MTPTASAHYMTIPSTNEVTYCCTPHTGSSNYMQTSSIITRSGAALTYAAQ